MKLPVGVLCGAWLTLCPAGDLPDTKREDDPDGHMAEHALEMAAKLFPEELILRNEQEWIALMKREECERAEQENGRQLQSRHTHSSNSDTGSIKFEGITGIYQDGKWYPYYGPDGPYTLAGRDRESEQAGSYYARPRQWRLNSGKPKDSR